MNQPASAITNTTTSPYQVLARKYRPRTFADLIGQEVLVTVLTNGMKSGRLPHAFVFTGIRGVGKTTTARILAKALNCTGRDIKDTVEPCNNCEACTSIAEDRHIDVIEMDAASRTGVDDIRNVIESAKYKATSALYKIYIIDEVHMLSKSAFNALLKTLEEPPAHVKFIFATTEIRKVPKTVLSRCMRFDLQRIDIKVLAKYLADTAANEGASIDENAAILLANAADGSARDGISLLDKAITLCQGQITVTTVTSMLGLAETGQSLELLQAVAQGKTSEALEAVDTMHKNGTDPTTLMNDLLDLTHTLTTLKISTDLAENLALPDTIKTTSLNLVEKLTIPTLTRIWQILLRGIEEVRMAPSPIQACRMVLIRIAYASTLPTPEAIIRGTDSKTTIAPVIPLPVKEEKTVANCQLSSFDAVVALVSQKNEPLLHTYLLGDVHLVKFTPGEITIRLGERTPSDLPSRLSRLLKQWTNQDWRVILSTETGMASLSEQAQSADLQLKQTSQQQPLVAKTLQTFPGSTIATVESKKVQHDE